MTPYFTTKFSLQDRLEIRSERITESGCQIWTGATNLRGYGILRTNKVNSYTHRLAYELYKGKIPDSYYVCHKCDNPSCINPNHLFLGTNIDNINDKVAKNRQVKGIDNIFSKLKNEDVRKIRNDLRKDELVAKDYGVCTSRINLIKNKKAWKHI